MHFLPFWEGANLLPMACQKFNLFLWAFGSNQCIPLAISHLNKTIHFNAHHTFSAFFAPWEMKCSYGSLTGIHSNSHW